MTEREALKLALEALEEINKLSIGENAICLPAEIDTAMDAIKEALAQPEQEPVIDQSVAVRIATVLGWTPPHSFDYKEHAEGLQRDYDLLLAEYNNLKAQRTWVGLTDDEIDQGLLRSDYAFKTAEAWRAGVVFAMTKLKEKNSA